MSEPIALALIALFVGVFLAVAFIGVVHAIGVALIVVAVFALVLLLLGVVRGRRGTR